MDNKTKVKIAVVIGIIILAVIFICMIVFVKGNRPPVNKNIPRKGEAGYVDTTQNTTSQEEDTQSQNLNPEEPVELGEIVSIGIKDGNLVEIDEDLNSRKIKKWGDHDQEFCYGDDKIYIIKNSDDEPCSVVEVDLTQENHPEKTILKANNYGKIRDIEYYEEKLYFITEKKQLIEYSISESFSRRLTEENEANSFTINRTNNNMFVSYKPNGSMPGIYLFDFTSNEFSEIVSLNEFAGELILNGKDLIFDAKELNSLFVYDIEKKSIVNIGADNHLENVKNQVAFFDNLMLYTNGSVIDIKFANGETSQDAWYVVNDKTIADISMITDSKLQIARYDENGANSGNITRSIIVELPMGTITEKPEMVYTQIVRIK